MAESCYPLFCTLKLRTWPTNSPANHIPYDQPVNPLMSHYDFSAQSSMETRPSIVSRISTRTCAYTPDHKFLCVCRPLKNICIVSVQAALHFNRCNSAARQRYIVVVSICFACRFPFLNKSSVLHMVQDMLSKLAFPSHSSGIFSANLFDHRAKQPAVVKVFFAKSVSSEFMRFDL